MDESGNIKISRRKTITQKVNKNVKKSWRNVKSGLGKILETKWMNYIVVILICMDIMVIIANLVIILYINEKNKEKLPHPTLDTVATVLDDVLLGLRSFYLFMIVVRVSSFGFIYLADPLNLFDAIIIILAGILYFIFKGKDKVISSLFIVCRLWRINRINEFSVQKRNEIHEEAYAELQRKLTTELEQERDKNYQLRKQLENNDHSLNLLTGAETISTYERRQKARSSKSSKSSHNSRKNNNSDGSAKYLSYSLLPEIEKLINI